mgnify:CR=1 FL=1
MHDWKDTERALPPRGQVVMAEDSGGSQQKLKLQEGRGALWFFADGSMYVYYTPKRWGALSLEEY